LHRWRQLSDLIEEEIFFYEAECEGVPLL
jgi:hypothetical protein